MADHIPLEQSPLPKPSFLGAELPSVVNRTALLFADISTVKESLRRNPFHFLSWEKLRFPVYIVHGMLMSYLVVLVAKGVILAPHRLREPQDPISRIPQFAIKSLVDMECSDGRV